MASPEHPSTLNDDSREIVRHSGVWPERLKMPDYTARNDIGYPTDLLPFGKLEPAGPFVISAHAQDFPAYLKAITPPTFESALDDETRRIGPYLTAGTEFLHFAIAARAVAHQAGVSPEEYYRIAAEGGSLSHSTFKAVCSIAMQRGITQRQIDSIRQSIETPNLHVWSPSRQTLGDAALHSTMVVCRDVLHGRPRGTYGFGDAKEAEIFEGKASIDDISFSAIASPKVKSAELQDFKGFVYRFCVARVPTTGEDGTHRSVQHPVSMIDGAVMDALEGFSVSRGGMSASLSSLPLLQSLSTILSYPVHDWVHGWFLYDVKAHSEAFLSWGKDIFFDVPHLTSNPLLINYEILSAWIHKSVWGTLFSAHPEERANQLLALEGYLRHVDDFHEWITNSTDTTPAVASLMRDYLAYVALSNLCTIHDPYRGEFADILNRYPNVKDQLLPRLGPLCELLHNPFFEVPSQRFSNEAGMEPMVGYVAGYPLRAEILTRRLEKEREVIQSHTLGEFIDRSRAWPSSLCEQIISLHHRHPAHAYRLLSCLEDVAAGCDVDLLSLKILRQLVQKIQIEVDGTAFLGLMRTDFDLASFTPVVQKKAPLLLAVPAGATIELSASIQVGIAASVHKQFTIATDKDVIAIEVGNAEMARSLQSYGQQYDGVDEAQGFSAILQYARFLGQKLGRVGLDDIYPMTRGAAEAIYGYSEPGYYEAAPRARLAMSIPGPIELRLRDGSRQRVIQGAAVYIPGRNTTERTIEAISPDIHGIEASILRRTYALEGGIAPITLNQASPLFEGMIDENITPEHASIILRRLLSALLRYDLTIHSDSPRQ